MSCPHSSVEHDERSLANASAMNTIDTVWPGAVIADDDDAHVAHHGLRDLFRSPTVAAVAFYLIVPLIATYPIVRSPARYAYLANPDALLNMWIPAWETHALRTQPTRMFDANIFYPERGTLAYSETLFGSLPVSFPVLLLGGSPILAFNIVLWLSFAATGLSMYLLARRLTGEYWAALIAGCIYAYVPYRFVHIPQIQLEAMFGFPLAFLYLDRFWESGRVRDAAGMGLVLIVQTLCCVYYGLFLATILAGGLVIPLFAPFNFDRRPYAIAACVLGIAFLCLAPLVEPYLFVHRGMGFERTLGEIAARSAAPTDYLASVGRVHRALWRVSLERRNDFLFPGIVATLFGAVGFVGAFRRGAGPQGLTPRRLIVYSLVGLFGVFASFGPNGPFVPVFRWLYEFVPLYRGIRAVSRFGVLALFAVSVFAAYGAAFVDRRVHPRARAYWQALVLILVVAEMGVAPLRLDLASGASLAQSERTPYVYRWLAGQAGDFPIVELPIVAGRDFYMNAPYMYWSTVHWKRLVNGYSGFAPPAYAVLADRLSGFPDEGSRECLEASGVRFVIKHWTSRSSDERAAFRARIWRAPWLRTAVLSDEADVYEVQRD